MGNCGTDLEYMQNDQRLPQMWIVAPHSQSIRRRRLFCVTARGNLTRPEYWSFLSAMVDDLQLQDCFVCPTCDRPHTTDFWDTPYISQYRLLLCDTDHAAISNLTLYCLKQQHIQIALRYSRSGLHQEHLDWLLSPHSDTQGLRACPNLHCTTTYHRWELRFVLYSNPASL